MSITTRIFAFACLIIACTCSEMSYVPNLMWSGKSTLPGKYLHDSVCSVSEIKKQISNVMNSQQSNLFKKKPKVIVSFVSEDLDTKKFAGLANSLNDKKETFSNLMNLVKTSTSSIVYPACKVDDSFLKNLKPTIIASYESFDENVLNFQPTEKTELVVISLGKSTTETEYKSKDAFMKRIVSKINKLTSGDYVGIFTTNVKMTRDELKHEQIGTRRLLSTFQTTTTNDTYWVNETMLVDESVLAGVISMTILLTIFILAFCAINRVSVSPHLTDAFGADAKKTQ
eukprot:gene4745-8327_t